MNDSLTRILLIEDNPDDAKLIQEMPNEAGSGQFHLEGADWLSTYAIQRRNMEAQLVARDRLASIGQLVSGVTH